MPTLTVSSSRSDSWRINNSILHLHSLIVICLSGRDFIFSYAAIFAFLFNKRLKLLSLSLFLFLFLIYKITYKIRASYFRLQSGITSLWSKASFFFVFYPEIPVKSDLIPFTLQFCRFLLLLSMSHSIRAFLKTRATY